jgi:hypothetical protein
LIVSPTSALTVWVGTFSRKLTTSPDPGLQLVELTFAMCAEPNGAAEPAARQALNMAIANNATLLRTAVSRPITRSLAPIHHFRKDRSTTVAG